MSDKKMYEKKLRAQLDAWRAEIDALRAKAERAEASARQEYYEKAAELRRMTEEAEERLAVLRDAGDDAWEDLKDGLEATWDTLRASVRQAADRFR